MQINMRLCITTIHILNQNFLKHLPTTTKTEAGAVSNGGKGRIFNDETCGSSEVARRNGDGFALNWSRY